jgi:hypothetical protein
MKRKPYTGMTTRELAAATKQFDEPNVVDRSRPLTKAERKQWERLKRKPGRPKQGQGFQRISVSIEKGLLRRVATITKQRQISRSKFLAQILEQVLASEK